jgi:FKBP-type peptidyl-prolyl cis-trans isomerase (trigger factor)
MRNSAGELLIDTTDGEPVVFLYGSGEILPHLEQPLEGMVKGEKKSFSLSDTEVPGLGECYTFDVHVEDIAWPNEDQPTKNSPSPGTCGPDCDCHH